METKLIDGDLVARILKLPYKRVWSDYDEDADVLYISFRKPQGANDSVIGDDGNIYNYHNKELVGVTVLNAGKRLKEINK